MLVKLSNCVADVRGRVAGNVYRRDRSGIIVSSLRTPIKRRSESQRLVRVAFRKAVTSADKMLADGTKLNEIMSYFPAEPLLRLRAIGYFWRLHHVTPDP